MRLSGSTEPGCSLSAEVEGNRWLYSRLITLVGKTLPARVKGSEKKGGKVEDCCLARKKK